MVTTPHLGLPLMAAAQAQKHVTHNAALMLIDALTQCVCKGIAINTPPASAAAGDCYVIGPSPTGAFASAPGQFAIYDGYAWQFAPVAVGNLVFNTTDSQFWFFDGTLWRHVTDLVTIPKQFDQLGVGTSADVNNRFAAKLNACLFTAKATSESGTGDLRLTLNKQASGNTASQIYQTNYSGRVETGLTGDDNYHLRLSPDGTNWSDGLIGYGASGAIRIDQLLMARSTNANKGRLECDFTAPNSIAAVFSDLSTVASATALLFRKNNMTVGSVQLSGTGTNYATTSDYRVKLAKGPIADALTRLARLSPLRFAFQSDPERVLDGFFAHDVADVVPEAVIGNKDACDDEGVPILQGLDVSRLVPLLVAAVQDLAKHVASIDDKLAEFDAARLR